MATIDRVDFARALSKCLAFLACGKRAEASHWGRQLVRLLTDAGVEF